MYKKTTIALSVLSALLISPLATFNAVAAVQTAAQTEADTKNVERIAVTGSKIKRIAAVAPSPVVVIGAIELADAGVSNVNDFLAEMPSTVAGLNPENSNNYIYANGLNTTDLRGLGSSRTLVLINGRRFIGGSAGDNTVDLNNIATSMVERIEISTGGASAVYGADAVAGVVNIITRKSFDGVEFDASTTKPLEGGGEQQFASFTFGKEFDKGGFIVGYDYADQKQMARQDKSWWYDNPISLQANPNDKTGSDGIPANLPYEGRVHYGLYDEASEFTLGGKQWTFDENLNLRPFKNGSGLLPTGGLPGAAKNWNYGGEFGDGIAEGQDEFFRTPLTRHTVNMAGHQEIAEGHELSFDIVYAESSAYGQSTPVFFRPGDLTIQRDNAFIKPDLAKLMDDNNATSLNFRRLSDDFGPRKYKQDRTTARASLGLDGQINDNWSYSTYAQQGKLTQDTSWLGEIIFDNLVNAIDAVNFKGNIVCAERNDDGEVTGAKAGCSPINFLGKPVHSQAALDYIGTTATAKQGGSQSTVGMSVSGDVFELPAGFISSAFSTEWRKESAYEAPGTGIAKGIIFGNSGKPYEGELTVKEYAAEFLVPLLADHAFAEELNAEFAYRFMDYSSTGTDYAYKAGLTYQLNDEWRFRLSKARSVRAPNIGELYSSTGTQYAGRTEACAADEIAKTDAKYKANVIKNCAADNIPVGWVPSAKWREGGSLEGLLGGNPSLKNEVSNDLTVGLVYTPTFIENFDFVLDYWSFDIDNAISAYTYANMMNYCYRADSKDNPFCGQFTRDKTTFEVTTYTETSLNAAIEKLSGVDLESVYNLDTDIGRFGFKMTATYIENRERNATGNAIDNLLTAGEEDFPRWRARFNATYQRDDLRLSFTTNYRHSAVVNKTSWSIENHNNNELPSYTTFDLTANYQVVDNVELRLGMQNIADRTPPRNPLIFSDVPGEYYDVIGRRVTAGVNVKF